MISHLWAKGSSPHEYVGLMLCRDVYHCTPVELAQVPYAMVMKHLICLDVEAEVRSKKRG